MVEININYTKLHLLVHPPNFDFTRPSENSDGIPAEDDVSLHEDRSHEVE